MPGRWIWSRSAEQPAHASMIEIHLSEAAKEDLVDIWISTQARCDLRHTLLAEFTGSSVRIDNPLLSF